MYPLNSHIEVLEKLNKSCKSDHEVGSYMYWENRRLNNLNQNNLNYNYPQNIPTWMRNHNIIAQKYNLPYISTADALNSFDSVYRYDYIGKLNELGNVNTFSGIKVSREKQNTNKYHVGRRSGVIPYIKIDDEIYFGLSVDSTYTNRNLQNSEYDLGDFGGGIEIGESIVTGAIREWAEESLSYFGKYHISPETIAVYLDGITIFFVNINYLKVDFKKFMNEISIDMSEEYQLYRENKLIGIDVIMPESKGIDWITIRDIKLKMKYNKQPIIYKVITPHLAEIIKYIRYLN